MNNEEDMEYLKHLSLQELKKMAGRRLIRVANKDEAEWVLPCEQDHLIIWNESYNVSERYFVVVLGEDSSRKTAKNLLDDVTSITFHEGLEIRPILKID